MCLRNATEMLFLIFHSHAIPPFLDRKSDVIRFFPSSKLSSSGELANVYSNISEKQNTGELELLKLGYVEFMRILAKVE